ncbi:hypothetical protein CspHIS471_0301880 [Cutaneotrichosporon sp. HIS471]|nr:hypothetical protein CspHIS471_0301880 [Cutaneotrichosporon sp. HIS471]
MKFTIIALFTLATAVIGQTTCNNKVDDMNTIEARQVPNQLELRTCQPTKCVCNANLTPGFYCGSDSSGCKKGVLYQCAGGPNGPSCEYGPRASCKQCNRLQC